jgi:flagellar protein FliS
MNRRAHQAYAASQIETGVASARPAELVVMVYERLFEHLKTAEAAFAEQKRADESIGKALELIAVGLQSCLDPKKGGDIANQLAVLYDWSIQQILLGKAQKNSVCFADVRRVLSPLAEGWRELAQNQSDAILTFHKTARANQSVPQMAVAA